MRTLTRRRFLRVVVVGGGAAVSLSWLDACGGGSRRGPDPTPTPLTPAQHFFSPDERAAAERIASALVPESGGIAGAATTETVEYIDRYLAAFDGATPVIYRGGPFSSRSPFPDAASGEPGDEFPRNDFLDALPLTRMQELAFRIELDGAAAVPGGDINAPLVPTWPGLRRVYREELAALAGDLATLDDDAVLARFGRTSAEFQSAFLSHVAEGMFGAPEYGGNADVRGWTDYGYDGDSQPLGHTLFDRDGIPRDRPDQPNQTADPRRPARAFSPEIESFLGAITLAQGGTVFF
jgi:hypothetical protein